MTPENMRTLIAAYLAEELSPEESTLFHQQLSADPALLQEKEALEALWQELGLLPAPQPSAALRARFYQQLNAGTPAKAPAHRAWWKLALLPQLAAAAVIFVVGLGVGRWQRQQPSEVSQLRSQVEGLRQTVALSLMEKPSASSRLEGVEWSSQVTRPDQELTGALLGTLNDDPNVNVRLAALDALERFISDSGVRRSLEQSIARQQSPLVQIALIDALVHVRDHSAASEFKQLSGDQRINASVRQRAQWAIEKLSAN